MSYILLVNDYLTNGFNYKFLDVIYLISIIFGVLTIISRNPIISVLYLIGLFISIASLLILVGFHFLGLSYILVYVGAISILFLFILMLINIRISELLNETNNDMPLAILTIMSFYYVIGQTLSFNNINFNLNFIFSYSTFIQKIMDKNMNVNNIYYASSNSWDNSLVDFTQISVIGSIMYTNYFIWLIIVSIILLLAMVGSIIITIKQK
jgi:NADH-ubiquinone oxidoreductase chain 6